MNASGFLLAGAVVLAVVILAIGSIFLFAPRCDRQIGDETDFPVFTAIAKAVCGASTLAP